MKAQELFDKMGHECWDVRCTSEPANDTGCCGDVIWIVVEHFQQAPIQRIVAFGSSPTMALEAAITRPMDLASDKCQVPTL